MRTRPWLLGNTTIRNPLRMRDALAALIEFPEARPEKGTEREIAFANFLAAQGVVSIKRTDRNISDLGRKWRGGLVKLGFIFPEGHINQFKVTTAGNRLGKSEAIAARQDCFLRSLACLVLPSVVEPRYDFERFSPFRYVVAVCLELKKRTGVSEL